MGTGAGRNRECGKVGEGKDVAGLGRGGERMGGLAGAFND